MTTINEPNFESLNVHWGVPVATVLVGAALLFVHFPTTWHLNATLTVPLTMWPRVAGILLIANVVTCWSTLGITRAIVRWLGLPHDEGASFKASLLITSAESLLYSVALIAGVKELIAVWLGFKAVSVWSGHVGNDHSQSTPEAKQRPDSHQEGQSALKARQRYNVYLFNTIVRLGFATLTYLLVLWTA